jgi:hypothetical protein
MRGLPTVFGFLSFISFLTQPLFSAPPPNGTTTTHWRESIPSPLDSSRRLEHSTHKKFVFRVSGCRDTRRVRIFAEFSHASRPHPTMSNNKNYYSIFEQDGKAASPAPRKKPPQKRVRQETPSPPASVASAHAPLAIEAPPSEPVPTTAMFDKAINALRDQLRNHDSKLNSLSTSINTAHRRLDDIAWDEDVDRSTSSSHAMSSRRR